MSRAKVGQTSPWALKVTSTSCAGSVPDLVGTGVGRAARFGRPPRCEVKNRIVPIQQRVLEEALDVLEGNAVPVDWCRNKLILGENKL
jgi:hypothetical protein